MIHYFFNFLLDKLYFFALSILHFLFKIFIEFRFLNIYKHCKCISIQIIYYTYKLTLLQS